MKRNIYLGLFVLILLGVTFYSEEYLVHKEEQKVAAENQLFNAEKLGDLQGMQTQFLTVKLDEGRFWVNDKLAKTKDIRMFFTNLTFIEVDRVLQKSEIENSYEDFFPKHSPTVDFKFDKGELKFKVGIKLPHDRSFYLEVKEGQATRWGIVRFHKDHDHVYEENEAHNSAHEYRQLVGMLLSKEEGLLEKKIFQTVKDIQIEALTMLSSRSKHKREEVIDFKQRMTQPAPPISVNYHADAFEKLKDDLKNIEFEQHILEFDRKLLKDKLRTITFKLTNKKITADIYRKYGSLEGYFLQFSKRSDLFELNQVTLEGVLFNHQALWDRRPLLSKFLQKNTRAIFSLDIKGERLDFEIPFSEKFKVNALEQGAQAIQVSFKNLFAILLNHADFIKPLSIVDWKDPLALKIGSEQLIFHFEDKELIVFNKDRNLSYHYLVGPQSPVSFNKEDYVK